MAEADSRPKLLYFVLGNAALYDLVRGAVPDGYELRDGDRQRGRAAGCWRTPR
jgi:hypothetical protein